MGTRIQMIDIVVVYKVKTPGTLCNNVSPNVKQNHSYLASSRPLKSESLGNGFKPPYFLSNFSRDPNEYPGLRTKDT